MAHWIGPLLAATILAAPYSCAPQTTRSPDARETDGKSVTTDAAGWTYNWAKPDTVFDLDRSLHEISGLTSVGDSVLIAVQDEKGTLYYLSMASGEIVDAVRFAKAGDYEGVEVLRDSVWVVRSDGDLIASSLSTKKGGKRYENELKARFDIEGIAAVEEQNRLLVAAKELAREKSRVIFSIDVHTRRVLEEETIQVSLREIGATLNLKKKVAKRFKPSGLALHPHSGQIYLLSSSDPAVIVSDRAGNVITGVELDDDLLPQPEGITFMADGSVFIASEGRNRGYLARFSPQAQHDQ